MKKSNWILTVATIAMLVGFQSCTKDFLDLEPKTGQVEANYYKTEENAFSAMVSVYDALSVQNWQFVPIMSDIFSDDAFAGGADAGDMRQWQEIEQNVATPENGAANDLWARCYAGVYRANLYLEKEALIEWKNEANKKRMNAEVKFLRAYFYWDLARHYGSVPVITSVLPSVEDYKNAKQNTPAEVYKQVATDLLDAIANLPSTVAPNEKGRATKYAAQALLARIFMYYDGFVKPVMGVTQDWSNGSVTINKEYAKAALDSVINSGKYQLMANYGDNFDWKHENNNESIFEWQYSELAKSGDWGGWNINGNFSVIFYGVRNPEGDPSIQAGWSFGTVSWSLVNEYEAGDPRKDVTVYDANANLTKYTKAFQNTGYFNKKWMPRTEFLATQGEPVHNYPVNYIDIRLADVLLMAAELNLADNPTKALDYLNRVRTRALGAGAALNTVTLAAIEHERRVELAGEGHRKWDLLRKGLDYAKQKIDASFTVPNGTPNAQDFTGRAFKTETWGMFPIPGSEIRNTNAGVLSQFVPAYK